MLLLIVLTAILCQNSDFSYRDLFSFGSNENGELGIGYADSSTRWNDTKMVLGNEVIVSVQSGDGYAVMMNNVSELHGVGKNSHGQFGVGDNNYRTSIELIQSEVLRYCSTESSIILQKLDGTFLSAGLNDKGQLGNGSIGGSSNNFQTVKIPSWLDLEKVSSLHCDSSAAYITTSTNFTHFYWIGDPHFSPFPSPEFTSAPFNSSVSTLECDKRTCVVKMDDISNVYYIWGESPFIFINDDDTTISKNDPSKEISNSNLTTNDHLFLIADYMISENIFLYELRENFSCGVSSNGSFFCFGYIGPESNTTDNSVSTAEVNTTVSDFSMMTYYGFYLMEAYVCYGVIDTVPSVCNYGGECRSSIDGCNCLSTRTGTQCDSLACFHVNATSELVCSGHGICYEGDNCTCSNDEYYFGEACDSWECDGILRNESSVCSGNGTCQDYDFCDCPDGYKDEGKDCSIPICFGLNADGTSGTDPCFGQGNCTDPNICTCFSGYSGLDCSAASYFEVIRTQAVPSFSCDEAQSFPPGRSRGVGFSFKNSWTYLFGGYGRDGFENKGYLNDVWRVSELDESFCFISGSETVNQTTSTYSSVLEYSPSNVISSRCSHSGFSSLFSFFVVGGEIGVRNETNEVWEFHIGTGLSSHQWRVLHENNHNDADPNQFSRRKRLCVAKIDIFSAYIFGGEQWSESSGNSIPKNDLWKFDSVSNEFLELKNGSSYVDNLTFSGLTSMDFSSDSLRPFFRSDHICWKGMIELPHLFVFGGSFLSNGKRVSGNDVWMYNATSSRWGYVTGGIDGSVNSISTYYGYSGGNLPSVRSGSIFFMNEHEFSGILTEIHFFGGMSLVDGTTSCDVWSFSTILNEFRFVNGTTPFQNKPNQGSYDIGSRAFGVGVYKKNQRMVVFGGELGKMT